MKSEKGFTLLELLLVIALLGVMSSVIVSTLPTNGKNNPSRQSEILAEAIRLATDQALIEGRIFGVVIEPQKWQIVELQPRNSQSKPGNLLQEYYRQYSLNWQPWVSRRLTVSYTLPDNFLLQLNWQGLMLLQPNETTVYHQQYRPQIWLMPGGEITPFEITLTEIKTDRNQLNVFTIRGDRLGQISVEHSSAIDEK